MGRREIFHDLENLFLGYAVVEGAIGAMGVLFHSTFVFATDLAYHNIPPSVNAVGFAQAIK
jgi:hypothetical protein